MTAPQTFELELEPEYGRPEWGPRAIPAPAAGAGVTIPVPGTVEWCVEAVTFKLVCSAVVANRFPFVELQDSDGVPFVAVASSSAVTAGSTVVVSFSDIGSSSGVTAAGRLGLPLPQVRIGDGSSVALGAAAIDVADQISDVRFYLRQYALRR